MLRRVWYLGRDKWYRSIETVTVYTSTAPTLSNTDSIDRGVGEGGPEEAGAVVPPLLHKARHENQLRIHYIRRIRRSFFLKTFQGRKPPRTPYLNLPPLISTWSYHYSLRLCSCIHVDSPNTSTGTTDDDTVPSTISSMMVDTRPCTSPVSCTVS